jgi:tetratricopeptide (TPR) repeat protein
MSSLSAAARGFGLAFVMLTHAGPLVAQQATTTGNQSPAIIGNPVINYHGMTSGEREAFAKQVTDKLLEALKGAPPAGPGAEQRVDQAVTAIAKDASEGDDRLKQALSLLAAGNVAKAVPLLEAVAADKAARVKQDNQVAATAYRNLGAIAGLADPKKAREAYAEAARLDRDNIEGMYWHGFLEADAGNLIEAEAAYRRVIRLGAPGRDDRALYWAHLGLGDIQIARGALTAAMAEYDLGKTIFERLAKADPGNAGWQRDLSVSFDRVGDVLVAQGNLQEALKAYRDSLAIRDRLAKADPGNAGWQRDLSVSFNKVGDVLVAQGNLQEALKA